MTAEWKKWEKEVINGVFPLHRAVSFSDHSTVFLTEYPQLSPPNALLKLVPAIPTLKEAQLAQWNAAAGLAHPNLIRVLETGRCQLGGLQFLFVVMEYAQLTLEKVMSQHALPPEAVRKLLGPILASLAFLHGKQLVQGGLKPSNILLVNQQLKLASDTVRPSGESAASIAGASVYDPPESADGSFSGAGDIWSLGVFMVEALTQCRPSWPHKHAAAVVLPDTLPPKFVQIIQRCLSRNPADRPTVAELEAQIARMAQTPMSQTSLPPPPVSQTQQWDVPTPQRQLQHPPVSQTQAWDAPMSQRAVTEMAVAQTFVAEVPLARTTARYPVLSPPRFPVLLPAEPADSVPSQLEDDAAEVATVVLQAPKRRSFVPLGAALLVAAIAVGAGLRLLGSPTYSIPTASPAAATQNHATATAAPLGPSATRPPSDTVVRQSDGLAAGPPDPATAADSYVSTATPSEVATASLEPGFAEPQTAVAPPSVLHEEAPDVPISALETIRGHIKFAVRVTIDGSGNVVQARLINHSPSRYFTRLAIESARKWKFVAADNPASRQWLLRFEFTRGGATAHANNPRTSRTDRPYGKSGSAEMRQAKNGLRA
jgi:serine/threonine protein kinase